MASLRIVQRIKAAACVEDRKPLPPILMWKTLQNERQLIPEAYRVAQKQYSTEMYFVLLMRFEMFVELKLDDSSDEILDEWSKATETKFNKNNRQSNFANVMTDLINFAPDVPTPAPTPTPAPAAQSAPPGDLGAMWDRLPPTPTPPSRKRARSVDVSHSDNEIDNETQSETPNDHATAGNSNREHHDADGAGSQQNEQQLLALMLEKMKANPSEHHQNWLGKKAMFRPDGEEEQLEARIVNSKVQGAKASFMLVTSDDREWWVDTISAAGAILHRMLYDKETLDSGLKPRKVAMGLLSGEDASGGATGGGATIPDIRAQLKALSKKGHAKLEDFIAEADAIYWSGETDRSVDTPTSIYTMQHGLTLQQIMFALNQPVTSSKVQTITMSTAFKEHAKTVVKALKRVHNLDTTFLKVLQVAFGSDLVPLDLNFLIASKHLNSDSESDEDEDLSSAPQAWNIGITQGSATLTSARKVKDLRRATKINTAAMAQSALHMLLDTITTYHGEQFRTVANKVLIFAPQLMARTDHDPGAMKRFLKNVWMSYKTTLAEAAAHARLVTTKLPLGATLPSAVQRHLRGLPEAFAEEGIGEAINKALKSRQRKATIQTEKTAALLLDAQARLTSQIAEQAAKIKMLEQQTTAKSPAPAPHGVGASSKRSGRASSKANRKAAKAATPAQQQQAKTNHSSGTSNVTPTWRDVKLGPPEKLLAHPDKLKKALFDNAKRFMSLAEAQRDYGQQTRINASLQTHL